MPAGLKPLIDGDLSERTFSYGIDTLGNFVPDYALYGTADVSDYYIAVEATNSADPVIEDGTVFWLNTDQNTTTGFSSIGAESNVLFIANADGTSPCLYIRADGQNLVSFAPFTFALSLDGKSLEVAIPRSLATPAVEQRKNVMRAPSRTARAEII
jgi:hypothetical protein